MFNYATLSKEIVTTLQFNTIFNYFNYLKKIITNYNCSLREIILKICKKTLIKLVKYYSKTKELNKILYNFFNILNSI